MPSVGGPPFTEFWTVRSTTQKTGSWFETWKMQWNVAPGGSTALKSLFGMRARNPPAQIYRSVTVSQATSDALDPNGSEAPDWIFTSGIRKPAGRKIRPAGVVYLGLVRLVSCSGRRYPYLVAGPPSGHPARPLLKVSSRLASLRIVVLSQ